MSAQYNTKKEIECLAKTIYHEARGEPEIGKKAVAIVLMNRAKSANFSNSICRVVLEEGQFPWKLNRRIAKKDAQTFMKIRKLATSLYKSYHVKRRLPRGLTILRNALFFSKKGFKNRNLKFVAKIGSHRFYTVIGSEVH
jgi:N-acetylmuramoyl-L-alanine amidase